MKRKVRIRRAQMGGMAAMQQTDQAAQQEVTDQDIVQAVIGLMQNGMDSDAITQRLVDAGIDQARVTSILSSIEERIQDEQALQEPEAVEDQDELDEMQVEQDMYAQQAAEEEEYKKRLAALYYSDEPDEEGYEEEQVLQDNILSRTGGALPSKRTFVKNTVNRLKAQNGTEMQMGKADSTDTGERSEQLSKFVTTIQGSADEALMKKDAEEIYNNLSSYMPEAQFGMNMRPGQQRRFNRRVNRLIRQIPQPIMNTGFVSPFSVVTAPMLGGFPQTSYQIPAYGSYAGGPRLANIDVRRTGLFGRPKEYTITFAQDAYTNPNLREQVIKQEEINKEESKKDVVEKETAQKTEQERDDKFLTFQPQSTGSLPVSTSRVSSGTPVRSEEIEETSTRKNYSDSSYKPYMDTTLFANTTAEEVRKKNPPITYNPYISSEGKIDGSKDFIDPSKSYTYDPLSKKWYRGTSINTKAITDKKAIESLNRWKSKGLLTEAFDLPTKNMTSKEAQDLMYKLQTTPQAVIADDKLIQFLTMMGMSPASLKNLSQFTLKEMVKGFLEGNTKGLPGQRAIEPGQSPAGYLNAAPKSLGPGQPLKGLPWSGYNVFYQQEGGFVDPDSPLTKFIYGGDDSFIALPETAGKLTNSPYFEEGGLIKAQAGHWKKKKDNSGEYEWVEEIHPANAAELKRNTTLPAPGITWEEWDKMTPDQRVIALRQPEQQKYYNQTTGYGYNSYPPYVFPGGYAKQKGLPYDPVTGETYYGGFSPGTTLSKIDVKKTRLSGMPKKYTMYLTDYFPEDTDTDISVNKPLTETTKKEKTNRPIANLAIKAGLPGLGAKMYAPETYAPTEKVTSMFPADRTGFQNMMDKMSIPFRKMAAPIRSAINERKNLPLEAYGGMFKAQTGGDLDSRFYPDMPSDEQMNMFIQGAPSLESKVTQSEEGIPFNDLLSMKKYVKGQVEKEGIDPSVFGDEKEMKKILADPKEKAVDFKTKMTNQERKQWLDMINAGGNRALDLIGERGDREKQRKIYERLVADNLYGSTGQYDRGTYETNSGLFRPDQMGFTGVVKYGGDINYEEGGETWMSEDDIKRFLEEGGELEFV